MPLYSAVVIDDDVVIRSALRIVLNEYAQQIRQKIEFFSADNGVEGLGQLFITEADIIVVDTTLPKYSGREVIEFLATNVKFKKRKIIVLHDGSVPIGHLPSKYIVLEKNSPDFLKHFEDSIAIISGNSKSFASNISGLPLIRKFLVARLISVANRSDLLLKRIFLPTRNYLFKVIKLVSWGWWGVLQFISSLISLAILLITPRYVDSNLELAKRDLTAFRIKSYPSLIAAISGLAFLLLQLVLFIAGGMVIFNVRLESIFANTSSNYAINLSAGDYDSNKIEFSGSELRLKQITVELGPLPASLPVGNLQEGEVANAEKELASIGYDTSKPAIVFKERVPFTKLEGILEVSSRNDEQSSVGEVQGVETLKSYITYQLSPDGEDWYYYNEEEGWVKTTNGFESSNSVQEINAALEKYEQSVGGDALYLKAFLHSDGKENIGIRALIVQRQFAAVSEADQPAQLSQGLQQQELILDPSDGDILESAPVSSPQVDAEGSEDEGADADKFAAEDLIVPTVFSASYVNGQKVVYGKLIGEDSEKVVIPQEKIENFRVRVYYTSSRDITKEAGSVAGFIGEARLEINSRGETYFLLTTPGTAGGYVTAQLMYKPKEEDSLGEVAEIVSGLSNPVENSTFTVDSTGDESDLSAGNGICLTGSGTCTLRAAIQEANALAGEDNIYFNIPTSDAGYRDYDDQNNPSTGDSLGGDDFWTIRIASSLPNIVSEIIIDGSSQETLSGEDRNISGPDIEVKGSDLVSYGINITGDSASGTKINKLAINDISGAGFGYGVYVNGVFAETVEITSNFIGTDVKGATAMPNNIGVLLYTSNNVSVIDNIVSGNNSEHIRVLYPNNIVVSKNNVGLNRTQTAVLGNSSYGILIRRSSLISCDNVMIGGDTPADGNIINLYRFFGNAIYIDKDVANVNTQISNMEIKNNIIGTNSTKDLDFQVQFNTGVGIATSQGGNEHNTQVEISSNYIRNYKVGIGWAQGIGASILKNEIFGAQKGIVASITEKTEGNDTMPLFTPGDGPLDNELLIEGNLVSGSTKYGIAASYGSSPIIKGNKIVNSGEYAILVDTNSLTNRKTRISVNTYANEYYYSRPIIGGTAANADSLCGGTDKNCFENNVLGGIYSLDTIPWNEQTLYSDNDFSNETGVNSIVQAWKGGYQIFSNSTRRTDLTNGSLQFILPSYVRLNYYDANDQISATNYLNACLDAANCPDEGISNSSGNTTLIAKNTSGLTYTEDLLAIWEYSLDLDGVKSVHANHKIDQNHFASKTFSFDANSQTDPVNFASDRVITVDGTAQTYNDLGEPWTDSLSASRDVQNLLGQGINPSGRSGYSFVFGLSQIAPVQYVDANPVKQQDGTYIITVDSTDNTENISTCGFDDGDGAYSGGGCGGASGLPDGKTTLREAILVANNFNPAAEVKIHFNIPASDTNHVKYQDDGVSGAFNPNNSTVAYNAVDADPDSPDWFKLQTTGSYTITGSNITIDGFTQPGASSNTRPFGETFNTVLKIETNNLNWQINGQYTTIKGMAFNGNNLQSYLSMNTSSSHTKIQGIHLGVDISGRVARGANNYIFMNAPYNTIGSDLDGVNDLGEVNIINRAGTGFTISYNNSIVDYSTVTYNYLNTDITTTANTGNFKAGYGVFFNNNIGTDFANMDGVVIKSNVIGNSDQGIGNGGVYYRPDIVIENNKIGTNWSETAVLNNFTGATRYGINLECVSPTIRCHGGVVRNNVVKNYTAIGASALVAEGLFDGFTVENNRFENNYMGGYLFGLNVSSAVLPKNIVFKDNFVKLSYISNSSAIFFFATTDLIITGNTIENGGLSIFGQPTPLSYTENVDFGNNLITNTGSNALYLSLVTNSVFSENRIYNNCKNTADRSIRISGSNNIEITNNQIGQNSSGSLVNNCAYGVKIDAPGSNANRAINIHDNIIASSTKGSVSFVNAGEDIYGITTNDTGDADSGANDLMNYPVIERVEYLGGGKYKLYGDIDNEVSGEEPITIEVCESYEHVSNHGGCLRTLGTTIANSPWEIEVTISGDDGTQNRIFSALATNALGSTSAFSENFKAETANQNYLITQFPIELLSPANNAQLTDATPELRWQASVDPDISSYIVYLDGQQYAEVAKELNSFTFSDALQIADFTWEVRSKRTNGEISGASSVWQFSIVATPVVTEDKNSTPNSYPIIPDSFPDVIAQPAGGVLDNDEVEGHSLGTFISEALGHPLALLALPTAGGTVVLVLFTHSMSISIAHAFMLIGAYLKRNKKYFGVVYDLRNREPIPFATLVLTNTQGEVFYRAVSDLKGRYRLSMSKKASKLDVSADGYKAKSIDLSYLIENSILALDIDLVRNESADSTVSRMLTGRLSFGDSFWRILQLMGIVGFAYSIFALVINPVVLNLIIAGLYVLAFLVTLYIDLKNRSRKLPTVVDITGRPIKGVVYRISDSSGNIIDTGLTDDSGKIKSLVSQGQFKISLSGEGYGKFSKTIAIGNSRWVDAKLIMKQADSSSRRK